MIAAVPVTVGRAGPPGPERRRVGLTEQVLRRVPGRGPDSRVTGRVILAPSDRDSPAGDVSHIIRFGQRNPLTFVGIHFVC